MKRDDFERSLNGLAGEFDAWLECNNEQEVKDAINCYVSSCAAQYEAERNSLLAVIAKQKDALRDARASFMGLHPDFGGPIAAQMGAVIARLNEVITLNPENVRLVETGHVMRNEAGTDSTSLYYIETTETSNSFIEAKGE